MAVKRDYYEVLGIGKNADNAAIKKAYRKLAKKYHPDSNAGNTEAEQKFKEVTEAYTILSDPEKKKLYDRFGHAAFDGSAPGSGSYEYQGAGPQGTYREYHFEGGDMDDIFGDIFGDILRGKKGDGHRYQSFHDGFGRDDFRSKGADLEAEVTVGFEEAAFGCKKRISLQSADGIQSLEVQIPAGIDDGQSIRLRGKGMPGSRGGEPGDLLLRVKIAAKPGFERRGMDIYMTQTVPFTTAVLGGETVIRTLYGDVQCKIPKGTQSGTKIRLRGKGIVSRKNPGVHGDQYAVIQIEVPRNLSAEAERKLREYDKACKEKKKWTAA